LAAVEQAAVVAGRDPGNDTVWIRPSFRSCRVTGIADSEPRQPKPVGRRFTPFVEMQQAVKGKGQAEHIADVLAFLACFLYAILRHPTTSRLRIFGGWPWDDLGSDLASKPSAETFFRNPALYYRSNMPRRPHGRRYRNQEAARSERRRVCEAGDKSRLIGKRQPPERFGVKAA
jgi:hypothetical protein